MDAYSEAMMRLSDARLADLCREAARHRLAAGLGRRARRAEARLAEARLPEARLPGAPPVAGVSSLPVPAVSDEELRRTA
jgi:hypothetical protein